MDDRLKQLLAKGREHYEKKEYTLAEPYLREVAEGLPDFADVQNMLGVGYFHQERYDLAQRAFEKALKTNPRYTEAALNLAVTYAELGKYDESMELQAGTLAATVSSRDGLDSFALGKLANMHAELAAAYEDLRMLEPAAREYREALELCPEFADIRTRLGHVMREMGDLVGAEVEYRKAKISKPSYVPARVYLGVALYAQGESDRAITEWEEAIGLDPQNRLAVTSLRIARKLEPQVEEGAGGGATPEASTAGEEPVGEGSAAPPDGEGGGESSTGG
jgi:tetratricopeptide (TPR) repeat protein